MCLPPPAGLHSWTGSSPRALEPALAMVLRAGCSWHSVNLLLSSSFLKLFNFWSCWVFAAVQAFSSRCSRGLLSRCGVRASHGTGFSLQSTGSSARYQ